MPAAGNGIQLTAAPVAAAPATAAAAPAVDIERVSTVGAPFIGDPKAPVTMALWFDYQCPFCKRLEETVMPPLLNDYVKKGKLRIVFKDLAFLGADSHTAAQAARAVWEIAPDKYYEWHKAMFEKQGRENSGWASKQNILALTKTIPDIDATKLESLMASHEADYRKAIEADGNEGSAFGISGTPGTIIGKQLFSGALPYDQFKSEIDAELAPK